MQVEQITMSKEDAEAKLAEYEEACKRTRSDQFKAARECFAAPDRDPYLLRHLVGDLYAVVGEWYLTEVERQAMVHAIRTT